MTDSKLDRALEQVMEEHKISAETLVGACLRLMQTIETLSSVEAPLKGPEKKRLVISTLKKYASLEDLNPDSPSRQAGICLDKIVELTIPAVIDTFIALDKGQIAVGVVKSLLECMVCC